MAEGWSAAAGNAAVTTLMTNYPWIKLHTAAPGSAATANAATETTRKEITSRATASAGSIASANALTWTSISGSQDATHFSGWDAATAGNFGWSGTITANSYSAGDTYSVPSGSISAAVTIAS